MPALIYHYEVAQPERATRVAVPILEAALAASRATRVDTDDRAGVPGGQ